MLCTEIEIYILLHLFQIISCFWIFLSTFILLCIQIYAMFRYQLAKAIYLEKLSIQLYKASTSLGQRVWLAREEDPQPPAGEEKGWCVPRIGSQLCLEVQNSFLYHQYWQQQQGVRANKIKGETGQLNSQYNVIIDLDRFKVNNEITFLR